MKRSFGLTGAALAVTLVALPAGAAVTIDHFAGGGTGDTLAVEAAAPVFEGLAAEAPAATTHLPATISPPSSEARRGPEPDLPPTEPTRPAEPTTTTAPTRPAPTRPAEADEAPVSIRLECGPRPTDSTTVIHCAWRGPEADGVVGFRVLRGVEGAVDEVARTREHSWTDRQVSAGLRYVYVVQAIDTEGRIVGVSNRAVAAVEARPAPVRLFCVPRAAEGQIAVLCEWSQVERGGVRSYQLWKSVGEGGRQLLTTVGALDARRHVDAAVEPGQRLRYAVVALDGDGNVVGQSEVVAVGIPAEAPRTSTTAPSTTRPAEQPASTTRPAERPATSTSTTRA